MNDLQLFLISNPVDNIVMEVKLGGRLSAFTFKVKALDGKQYNEYQTLAVENPNSNKKRSFNAKKFNELIIVNCVIEPNFKDADFIKKLGVPDAISAVYKTLASGEIAELSEQILSISGFGNEIEDAVEEAKNS